MKIIFINGPPRSGKDTACNIMLDVLSCCFRYRMSYPLKRSVNSIFSFSVDDEVEMEKMKDIDLPIFNNHTYRDMQIEQFKMLERLLGSKVLGNIAVSRMKELEKNYDLIIVPDAGKDAEIEPIIEEFGVNNVYLLYLSRPNTSFVNDIRIYIDYKYFIPDHIRFIDNKFDLETYNTNVMSLMKRWKFLPA